MRWFIMPSISLTVKLAFPASMFASNLKQKRVNKLTETIEPRSIIAFKNQLQNHYYRLSTLTINNFLKMGMALQSQRNRGGSR